MNRDLAGEVRRRLQKPKEFVRALGLKTEHATGNYCLVLCPTHGEKNASCSVYRRNNVLRARCPACDWNIGLFDFIALVNGLSVTSEFKECLAIGCELAGMQAEADEVRGGKKAPPRQPLPPLEPEPERDYPPLAEVDALWRCAQPVTGDPEASDMLERRRIDPAEVAYIDAARVLHPDTHHSDVPPWARFRGRQESMRSWLLTGHRMLVPVYDAHGQMRSVRAWLVTPPVDGMPKRVPPGGYRASGLVLSNARGLRWLRGESSPSSIVVCEGEPDHLVRSIAFQDEAIVGVGSGSWTDEFAQRVPYGSEVSILTHLDGAGDRYAAAIEKSVASRAQVFRWTMEAPEAA